MTDQEKRFELRLAGWVTASPSAPCYISPDRQWYGTLDAAWAYHRALRDIAKCEVALLKMLWEMSQ